MPTITGTVEFTDIENELLSTLKDLVFDIQSHRQGTMGEAGTVYTGSISKRCVDRAKEVIRRAEVLRSGGELI